MTFSATDAGGMPSDRACNENAKSLLDESLDLAGQLPDEDPGGSNHIGFYYTLRLGYARLLGDLVVTYGRAGCWSGALQALEAIERRNIKLEAQVHLLDELLRQGELQAATRFRDGLEIPDNNSGREARETMALLLGRGFVLSGAIEIGRQQFDSVKTRWQQYDSPVFLFVKALLDAGYVDEATRYISSLSPLDEHRRNANLALIEHLIMKNEKEAAKTRIQSLVSGNSLSSFLRSSLSRLYALLRDLPKAIEIAKPIESEIDLARSLVRVVQVAPDETGVEQVLETAVEAMKDCVGNDCNVMWLQVARAHAEAGLDGRAVQLAKEQIDKERWQIYALSEIAIALARRGQIETATEIVPDNAGPHGDRARAALAVAHGRIGDFDSAFAAIENIRNPFIKLQVATALATLPLPSERIQAWLHHADRFPERIRAGVYQVMLSALARRGEADTARSHVGDEGNTLTKARSLLGLAQGELGIVTGERLLALRWIL